MTRKDAFEGYKAHPWLGKQYSKLTVGELVLARAFIDTHTLATKSEFESRVLRMFMDVTPKPKHWSQIEELLLCANSAT